MVVNDLTLRWTIRNFGSARLAWAADQEIIEIATTYIGDGLRSLLRAALDLRLGSTATVAGLPGEPAGHVLQFTGAAEDVYVQIVFLPNADGRGDRWRGAELRWAASIPVRSYVAAATRMAEAVLAEHGADGYQHLWGGTTFPSAELASLQAEPR